MNEPMDDLWRLTERGETVVTALDSLRMAGIAVQGMTIGQEVITVSDSLAHLPSAAEMIAEADAEARQSLHEQLARDREERMRRIADLMDPMRGAR